MLRRQHNRERLQRRRVRAIAERAASAAPARPTGSPPQRPPRNPPRGVSFQPAPRGQIASGLDRGLVLTAGRPCLAVSRWLWGMPGVAWSNPRGCCRAMTNELTIGALSWGSGDGCAIRRSGPVGLRDSGGCYRMWSGSYRRAGQSSASVHHRNPRGEHVSIKSGPGFAARVAGATGRVRVSCLSSKRRVC